MKGLKREMHHGRASGPGAGKRISVTIQSKGDGTKTYKRAGLNV